MRKPPHRRGAGEVCTRRGWRRQRQGIRSPIQQGDPFIAGQG